MAEIQNTENTVDTSESSVSLSDIFFMTLRHWPWIILSVVLCVGVAYLYLLRTPDVYTHTAEIQIKEDDKGKSVGVEDFADLGLFKSNTNIQNEMINLMARDLMEEVVRRLGLDINYSSRGQFHDEVVYGTDLPVRLTLTGTPDEDGFTMNLSVAKDGKVTVKELTPAEEETIEKTFAGKLGDTIVTPVGKMVVSPTAYYHKGEPVELIIDKMPLSDARDSYNERLKVELPDEKGTVIRLTFSDPSEQRADEVLNTLIGVYNENWIRDKNQIAVSTSNFINDRLGVIENELGDVDSDISAYKSANLVPDIAAAASMYMTQSQQNQTQILEVSNQLSMARYIRSYLSADAGMTQLLPANTGLEGSNIQSLVGEYNSTLLQRNALVAKSSDKNPLVAQIDDQLAAQRQAVIKSVDNEIVALETQLKALRGSEAQTMSRIASNPTQAKNLLSTERQQKVKEALYLFLLQKREDNELSQAFTAYNTRIVNRPGDSGQPPKPNRRAILAIAFLFGLAIPFGVTYVSEISNTRLRGRKDVEGLAIPFVGEIPLDKKDKNAAHDIVVTEGKRDIINEAFRVVRTNVEFMCGTGGGHRLIAVTSFNPGSGKSFISVNLAMTIAIKGKRVLVIDGDMRHGSTSAYVGSPKTGIANYLSGAENDIEPLIVVNKRCPNLNILPVGSIPPNPAELLETPRFAELLDKLKGMFDYVIIDCPPIEVVADAQIINRYVDRTFFVIRAGLLQRTMLPVLDRLYEEKKYRNMAFILNGTRNDRGVHTYSYGYGYGYGYGYNYGNGDSK